MPPVQGQLLGSVPARSSGATAGPWSRAWALLCPSLHTGTPRAEGPSQLGLLSRLDSPSSLSLSWARRCSRPSSSSQPVLAPLQELPVPAGLRIQSWTQHSRGAFQGWAEGQGPSLSSQQCPSKCTAGSLWPSCPQDTLLAQGQLFVPQDLQILLCRAVCQHSTLACAAAWGCSCPGAGLWCF